MKKTLTFVLFFFIITMQAQVVVSEHSDEKMLLIEQVLTNKDYDSNSKSTMKLLTEEVSVQIHDGKVAYKTIQDVEYTIRCKGTKISTKRNILGTKRESICPEGQAEQVFPDMTTSLLSSVLAPQLVRLEGKSAMLPFTLTTSNQHLIFCIL